MRGCETLAAPCAATATYVLVPAARTPMVPKRHTRCTAHTLSARTRRRAHPREIPRRPRLAGWLAGESTMDWVTVAPSAGILTTLLCCPALHSTLYHHVPLLKVHRRVDRNASDALEEWMSRLVAPHPTSFSSHPTTILPIPDLSPAAPDARVTPAAPDLPSALCVWCRKRLSYPTLPTPDRVRPRRSADVTRPGRPPR